MLRTQAEQVSFVRQVAVRARRVRPRLVHLDLPAVPVRPRLTTHQHRELGVVVGMADVLDTDHPPAPLVHDLHRPRTGGGGHLPG
jgi:hypothetical protein